MADELFLNTYQAEVVDRLFAGLDLSPRRKIPITKVPPRAGDHLAVKFRVTANTFAWHHGIYMGQDTVIDHSKKRGLTRRPYSEFGDSEFMVYVVEYEDDGKDSTPRRQKAIQLASWTMKNAEKLPYKLLKGNCECLATWCSTGRFVTDMCFDTLHTQTSSTFYQEKSLLQSIFRTDTHRPATYS